MQGPDPVHPAWREILRYYVSNPGDTTWSFSMNIQDIFYHGVRDQVRRVVSLMTDEEIERGLTAFETGASNWSHCFFARACPSLDLDEGLPEHKLVKHFGLPNAVPIRIVYCTFDGCGVTMSRDQLRDFIRACRLDGEMSPEVLAALKGVDYAGAEEREVTAC